MVEHALRYARCGWPVFPLDGKKPRTRNGFKDASVIPEQIREWWTRWPDAGIGVPTGELSGVVVLDVDARHGGKEALTRLEVEHGNLPETARAKTGSGQHWYFQHPGTLYRNATGWPVPGLDLRGDGGYVAVPPSPHPNGSSYEWYRSPEEVDVAPLPSWLSPERRQNGHSDVPLELPARIPYGRQHDHLVSAAGTFRRRGLTEAEIAAALKEVNRLRCEKPGTDETMEEIARSVCRNYDPELDAVVATTIVKPRGDEDHFKVVPLRANRIRRPRWAFEDRILVGALNALVGAGGVGKGTFVAWLIAGWTRGELPGDLDRPANILVVGDEDDLDEVWTPRIMAAGGDVSHVLGLEYAEGRALDLARDVKTLERFVVEREIDVVYLDQVLDHIGGDLNANLPRDVRQALAPVRSLARRLDKTVLYTSHPIKGGASSLRDRTGGSHQFTDLPRSGLFLGYHPDEPGRRALARGKGNVGIHPPALTFDIESSFATNPETSEPVEVGVVANLDAEEGLTAEQIQADAPRERGPTKTERAIELLRGLGADGRWRTRRQAEDVCRDEGIGLAGFRSAWAQLPKETRKNPDDNRETDWRINANPDD